MCVKVSDIIYPFVFKDVKQLGPVEHQSETEVLGLTHLPGRAWGKLVDRAFFCSNFFG